MYLKEYTRLLRFSIIESQKNGDDTIIASQIITVVTFSGGHLCCSIWCLAGATAAADLAISINLGLFPVVMILFRRTGISTTRR